VYLCAFAIDEEESCASAAGDPRATAISHNGRPDLTAGFSMDADGRVTLDPKVAAACFYNDCDAESTTWATSRLSPQLLASLQQSPAAVAWRTTPSTYAVCTADLTVHPGLQRLLAQRCTTSVEWPTGHSPFLSRPDLVVELLVEVAGRGPSG
jgi:pimeloyl-ACP methyl ester carboxylesterase